MGEHSHVLFRCLNGLFPVILMIHIISQLVWLQDGQGVISICLNKRNFENNNIARNIRLLQINPASESKKQTLKSVWLPHSIVRYLIIAFLALFNENHIESSVTLIRFLNGTNDNCDQNKIPIGKTFVSIHREQMSSKLNDNRFQ